MPRVIDVREKPFFTVDNELVDNYITLLSGDAFKMLIWLVRLEDLPDYRQPAELDFPKMLNMSNAQVKHAQAELCRANLLFIERDGRTVTYGVTTPEERAEAPRGEAVNG